MQHEISLSCRDSPGPLPDRLQFKRPYDSPLLFTHGNRVWLVGRRNVTDSGHYDLDSDFLPQTLQFARYQADYWTRPKRCALWEVNPEDLSVRHWLDLPSKGDTCFAEVLPLDDDEYLLFNYTSPLGGDEVSWREGQNELTLIYAGVLRLPAD